MSSVFFNVGLLVVAAALTAIVSHLLRQPPMVSYIVTGLLVGPVLGIISPSPTLEGLSTMGVAFLLYLVGLKLKPRVLREVGTVSIAAGMAQIFLTAGMGYVLATLLGFTFIESLYIGIALTFSSTVVVVKLITDKGDLDSLYGKIAVGILLVQDFVAIAVMVLISAVAAGGSIGSVLGVTLVRTLVLISVAYAVSRFILPPVMDLVAESQELLFLTGIAWMFIFTGLASVFELSIEIGAFLAGISMASLPYTYDLSSRLRPLRDFFIVLFFILIGSQVRITSLGTLVWPLAVLSAFVLLANSLITMTAMGVFGHRKRTSFLTGLHLSQISEFSLIVLALGVSAGHITADIVTLVTLVGLVTIAVSVYLITHSDYLYRRLDRWLEVFERGSIEEPPEELEHETYRTVLVGADRMGSALLRHWEPDKDDVAIIDFNPSIVHEMKEEGYHCVYGDISDTYVLDGIRDLDPDLIISTVPRHEDTMTLLQHLRGTEADAEIFVTAGTVPDARQLYNAGANYVVMPDFLGGERAAELVADFVEGGGERIDEIKEEHRRHLDDIFGGE